MLIEVGTCTGLFYDVIEQHVLRNRVMTIKSGIELMLGFCPRVNLYVPAIFCILISFLLILFCGHDMLFLFLLAKSTSQGKVSGTQV